MKKRFDLYFWAKLMIVLAMAGLIGLGGYLYYASGQENSFLQLEQAVQSWFHNPPETQVPDICYKIPEGERYAGDFLRISGDWESGNLCRVHFNDDPAKSAYCGGGIVDKLQSCATYSRVGNTDWAEETKVDCWVNLDGKVTDDGLPYSRNNLFKKLDNATLTSNDPYYKDTKIYAACNSLIGAYCRNTDQNLQPWMCEISLRDLDKETGFGSTGPNDNDANSVNFAKKATPGGYACKSVQGNTVRTGNPAQWFENNSGNKDIPCCDDLEGMNKECRNVYP